MEKGYRRTPDRSGGAEKNRLTVSSLPTASSGRKFTSRLEVPIFINDELVTFGQTYAQENGYRIDEMGILALYKQDRFSSERGIMPLPWPR